MGKLLGSAPKSQDEQNSITNSHELSNKQSASTPQNSNSNNPRPLSSSLVTSVNVAAETARFVLDQSFEPTISSSLPNVPENQNYVDWSATEGKPVSFSSPLPQNKSSGSINKLDISIQSELTANTEGSGNSSQVPGSTPPPLAFQNLPMSRYMPVSSHDDNMEDRDVMGGTRPFEVTNHYDAAAAISAALASSHLAQASYSVGELQGISSKKGFRRDESFSDDSAYQVVLNPSKSYKNEINEKHDKSSVPTPATCKSPSREKAEENMGVRRRSFQSSTDDSLTDYSDGNLKASSGGLSRDKSNKGGGNDLFENFLDNAYKAKLNQASSDDSTKSGLSKVEEKARRNSNQTEGMESISICSSDGSINGRSNFENESNTSSYGSSDFSPITMSFGSSSDDGKHESNNNVAGILGTLAKPPTGVVIEGDASYSEEDNSQEGGGVQVIASVGPRPLVDVTKLSKHLAPSRTPLKIDTLPTVKSAAVLPINQQYVSLFKSFDRNLASSLEETADKEKMFELSQQFLSSFVAVLGVFENETQKKAKMSGGDAVNVDTGLTNYDWWSDDSKQALGYNLGVVTNEKSDKQDTALDKRRVLGSFGVPTIVVRSLWTACFFDGSVSEKEIEKIIDSIQDNLVNNLHYLAETEDAMTPCLCLSLPLYNEYAWHVLHCRSQDTFGTDETVVLWHSKFATFLQEALLMLDKDDSDSLTLLRYTVYALPRHMTLGIHGNGQDGELTLEINAEKLQKVETDVVENMLCNAEFTKARLQLLGCILTKKQLSDESTCSEGDKTLMRAIEAIRSKDTNCLPATVVHIKDIERCCELVCEHVKEDMEGWGDRCVNALTMWRRNLLSLCSGDNTTLSRNDSSKPPGDNFGMQGSCIFAAKYLLGKDDAWSINDAPEESAQNKKPSRSLKSRNRSINSESVSTAISVDICQLKTELSIGRSILSLAKFAQRLVSKNKSYGAPFILQEEIARCLRDAIDVLSSISKTLQLIMSIGDLEEDDIGDSLGGPVLCIQKFALTRAEAKPLITLTGIFLAECWFLLGKMSASQSTTKNYKDKLLMVACFDRALLILSSSKKIPSEQLLEPLTKHKVLLQSNVNHSMGVCLYEAGVFDRSERCLNDAIILRRKLLNQLRNQTTQPPSESSRGILETISSNLASYFFFSPQAVPEEVLSNVMEYCVGRCCDLLPLKVIDKSEADDLELSLSLTLEYSALTHHANQSYQKALASFQESLILRSIHVGKNSLDIASLHFNTGVVHDDLEQYHQAINRYHESLRIRLIHLKEAPEGESEIEDSVLLTLKCMAHVYKLLDDLDNAIAFYIKALLLLKSKILRHTQSADKWQIMGMRFDLAVPSPTVIFDEMRKETLSGDAWKSHFQTINKKLLCHSFSESDFTKPDKSYAKLEKDLSKMHSMIVALIQKKKHSTPSLPQSPQSMYMHNSSRKASISLSSPVTLETLPKSQLGNLFDIALMSSSFCLGRSRMKSARFDEAVDQFEVALRTKWALDPALSSDSDSEASSSRLSSVRSKVGSRNISEDEPEEGQLYYALGLANAMLDDHERALRCFITSLRYLRRALKMVDSLEVARVLFDTGTSYYFLCNFDQAEVHWSDCLRILRNNEINDSFACRKGVVLYCIVLSRTAQKTVYDTETYSMLNEAQTLLSKTSDKTILAYMEFLTGYFLLQNASRVPLRLRPQIPAKMAAAPLMSSIGNLSWEDINKTALSLFEQVKNECWFDISLEETANMNDLKHLPVSAHACLLEGQVLELMGRSNSAMNSYKEALNLYCIACGHENVFSASVMHRMGMLCVHSKENGHKALGFFDCAASTRKQILGGNDPRLAESLYCSASILSLQRRYESAMERYHEALRIQIVSKGQSSNEVATTLTSMGLCHYNHKSFDSSLACFMGALKVRNHRVTHLQKAMDDAKKAVSGTDISSSSSDENSSTNNTQRLDEIYAEETALGNIYFNLGNVHLRLGDHEQSMSYFIKARDVRWRHVGGGSTEKIMKRYLWSDIDEDELLGLAHCLHNIGLLFDMKKEHDRSLPHYEEALTIKNALAGFGDSQGSNFALTDEKDNFILRCLDDSSELPVISKATLSTAMTHIRMASVYAKKKLYNYSLRHYCQALKIQRKVLGRDHFTTSVLLNNMGNVLNRTRAKDQHTDTVEFLYKESLRISSLSLGKSHERVASTMFNLGELYDSKQQFDQAIGYYRSALSVYRDKYSTRLRQRLCNTFQGTTPSVSGNSSDDSVDVLSTGDQIVLDKTSFSTKEIQKQYSLVSEALRKATRKDVVRRRGETWLYDSNEYWLRFEILLFQLMEMLSTYVVDPTNTAVKNMITQGQQRIESAASHAIITAADALDYQFQLMLQE